MSKRATAVNLSDRYTVTPGEPMLDTDEGVLVIQYDDGTSRIFNWAWVTDYYYMTESEYAGWLEQQEEEDDE